MNPAFTTYLNEEQVNRLYRAAIALALYEQRDVLLSSFPSQFAAGITKVAKPAGQLLIDINTLNKIEALNGGFIPLKSWLNNASLIAYGQVGNDVFQEYLALFPSVKAEPAPLVTANTPLVTALYYEVDDALARPILEYLDNNERLNQRFFFAHQAVTSQSLDEVAKLTQKAAIALCMCGDHTIQAWQQPTIEKTLLAQLEYMKRPFRVIPVLLPGILKRPKEVNVSPLRDLDWVALDSEEPSTYQELVGQLMGEVTSKKREAATKRYKIKIDLPGHIEDQARILEQLREKGHLNIHFSPPRLPLGNDPK